MFTPDDGKCPTFNRRVADNVSFNRIDITSNDVIRYIKNVIMACPQVLMEYHNTF